MAKGLTIASLAIAALLLLVFAVDLAIGIPFGKARPTMNIVFIICSIGLAYISWTTFREIR